MGNAPKRRPRRHDPLASGRRILTLAFAAFATLAGLVIGVAELYAPAIPPRAVANGVVGSFELVDQDGRLVTDASYRGKWLLVYFGYTHCPDACPTALNDMADALAQLGPLRQKLQPLFITVDPQRDTPMVMKDYTAAFEAGIVGLTGSVDQVDRAAKAFGVQYRRGTGSTDYAVAHSSIIMLTDPQGRLVTSFTHESSPESIRARLRESLS